MNLWAYMNAKDTKSGWFYGRCGGREGAFPGRFVEPLFPTAELLRKHNVELMSPFIGPLESVEYEASQLIATVQLRFYFLTSSFLSLISPLLSTSKSTHTSIADCC